MNLIPRFGKRHPHLFEDLFENFWPSEWPAMDGENKPLFSPKVDISERENHYLVRADLPGVHKEDISLNLNNGILTLEAEHKDEHDEQKDGKMIRRERHYGKLVRSFNVGSDVQDEDIQAEFKNGVLELTLPKVQPQTPESRQINIH